MIKRIIMIGLCLSLAFGSAACGISNSSNAETQMTDPLGSSESSEPAVDDAETDTELDEAAPTSTTDAAEPAPVVESPNILVVYFSRVGITDLSEAVDAVSSASIVEQDGSYYGNATILADMIVDKTGADSFQIITEAVYPTAYRDTTDLASIEQNENARPALSSHVQNMDQYDYIFLVYPNWWGDLPMPVYTFLEEYDLSQKVIAPLATHGGSGLSQTEQTIADLTGATMVDGLAVSAGAVTSAQPDVDRWIDGMDLPE